MRAALMRRLARHAGLRVFRFFARPLEAQGAVPPAGLELRFLAREEFSALSAQADLDLPAEKSRAALEKGDLCAGAFENGTLAGYCWLAFSPVHHLDGVWVRFADDVLWIYKSFVRPSHRGRGIAPALYRFAEAAAFERARTRALICVESHNAPSITAARRAGYADAGYAAYWRRGPTLLDWYSPGLRMQALRFYVPGR